MKKNIKYFGFLAGVLLLMNTACSDYLIEDNKTGATEDMIYSTRSGLEGLIAASYSYSRGWYGKEAGIGLSEGGTDTWLTGFDNRQKILIDYSGITAEPAGPALRERMNATFDEYWEMLYTAVNTCNTAIKYINQASDDILSESDKEAFLGEVKFLRAFYYWHLVETWGPVQINREPVSNSSSVAKRDSEADVYEFMLNGIAESLEHLSGKMAKSDGRVNYWAAKSLQARLLLYKGSKFNDNQAYAQAATAAEEVITGSGASFYANYAETWMVEDGIPNKEAIWWIDYSDVLAYNIMPKRLMLDSDNNQMDWAQMIIRNGANSIGGNASHLMYVGVWNFVRGGLNNLLIRTDTEAKKSHTVQFNDGPRTFSLGSDYQPYSKGFTRFVPSGYLLDLFDDENDQRYQGSFRDTYMLAQSMRNQDLSGVKGLSYPLIKDTAIFLSKKEVSPEQREWAQNRYMLLSRTNQGDNDMYALYEDAAATSPTRGAANDSIGNSKGNRLYIQLKKFDDYSGSVIRDLGSRDFLVFRLAEMYLIAAEGHMMSGNSGPALSRINELRNARAITGMDNSLKPADAAKVNAQNIEVILDERARELCGEQQRWFDLKRTGALVEKVKMYNKDAGENIQPYHVLRPIPQAQMDAVINKTDGADPDGFWQNNPY